MRGAVERTQIVRIAGVTRELEEIIDYYEESGREEREREDCGSGVRT